MAAHLTIAQVCSGLGKSRWSVNRYIAEGRLAKKKAPNGRIGITRASYKAFLQANGMEASQPVRPQPALDGRDFTPAENALGLPKLFELSELAAHLGVPVAPLVEAARDRKFRHYKIGQLRYATVEGVRDLLDAHAVTTAAEDRHESVRKRVARRRTRTRPSSDPVAA